MRIKLFSYLTIDYKAGEAMLNRMAAEGWELKRLFLGLFAIFQRTERTDLRYFVDFGDSVYYESPDYLALCADAGWVSVGYTRSMNLYASAPGAAPVPLQTDSALEYERFRKLVLKRVRTSGIVYVVLGLALALFVPFGGFDSFMANLCYWISYSHMFSLLFLSLPGILVCGGIYMALLLSRVRKWRALTQMDESIPVPEHRGALLHGILTLLGGVFTPFFELSFCMDGILNQNGLATFIGYVIGTLVGLAILKTSTSRRRGSVSYVGMILGFAALLLLLKLCTPGAASHLLQPESKLPTASVLSDKIYGEQSRGSWLGRVDRWVELLHIDDTTGILDVDIYTCRFNWMTDSLEKARRADDLGPYVLRLRRGNTLLILRYPEELSQEELQEYVDTWQKADK